MKEFVAVVGKITFNDLRAKAREVLVAAKVLAVCPDHATLYDPEQVEPNEAYKLAHAWIKTGKINLGDWSEQDFRDALKLERDESGALDYCTMCKKTYSDE